jgi:lysylphosphatidylglycerol synthase-like protein
VRILLLIVGVLVMCLVLYFMGVHQILQMVRRSGWSIAWMTILYAIHIGIRGWVIWRSLPEPRLPLLETIRIRFAAEAVEMLTFTGPFLAEPAKGFMFIKRGVPPAQAAGVIAFEYLIYMAVAALMALGGLLALLSRGAFHGGAHDAIVALVCGLAAFSAGVFWAAFTGIGLLTPLMRLLSPALGARRGAAAVENVGAMEAHLLDILHGSPTRFIEALVAQAIGHALLAVEIFVLFHALGFAVRLTDPLIVEGGVKFINAAFVFIPGQFGAAEGSNALIVGALGYPGAAGVTLSLMRRVRAYLVAGAGVIVAPRH